MSVREHFNETKKGMKRREKKNTNYFFYNRNKDKRKAYKEREVIDVKKDKRKRV